MSTTTKLGDISIPISKYIKDGHEKRRGRTVGELLATDDEHGRRYWMKLDAEQLSPSLLIVLSRNQLIKKDEDSVIANVYAAREPRKPSADSAAPASEDGIPF